MRFLNRFPHLPAASTPAGLPIQIPGAPAWARTLANTITAALAQNTVALNALSNRVTSLEHYLSTARTHALLKNGSCTEPKTPLHSVPNTFKVEE